MLQILNQSKLRAEALLSFILVFALVIIPATFLTHSALAKVQRAQSASPRPPLAEEIREPQAAAYDSLPLSFELNQGQTDSRVKFFARNAGYLLFLTPTEAVMALENPEAHQRGKENRAARSRVEASDADDSAPKAPRAIVRMKLAGANSAPRIEGLEPLNGPSNYFTGSNPGAWRTNVPSYARVRYSSIYPGIDMVYYGNQRRLEYDFVLAPGANPAAIRMTFGGISNFEVNRMGDLVLRTKLGEIRQAKPCAYQEVNGVKREVEVNYAPSSQGSVGIQLGNYDQTRPLIIDPVLVFSSYLGGSGFDQGYAIAVDAQGNTYVTGRTAALDFPTTPGAFQTSYGGGDAFVAKINPAGNALVYSTYLNGASGNGIAVDSAGSAYVTGEAGPLTFPTTAGAFQTSPMGYDAFITKLSPSGSTLVYSARFGGIFDDFGRGIALDSAGNAYITGWTVCRSASCLFPTVNAFQPNYGGGFNDAFVSKINSSGSALVYSTYLGGGQILNATEDWGEAIAVDSAGSAYVTGYTYSPDFPVTAGAYDTNRAGLDAFITKFTPGGNALVYSTFLGGPAREMGQGIAVDASGNAYIAGATESSDNPFTSFADGFPVTVGAFQRRGSFDAFVTKLNPQGSALVYSTYLGGNSGVDRAWAIAVDNAGNAYIAGDTTSNDFPVANAIQATNGGGQSDAFVTKLNAAGSALVYSTYLGGSFFDEGRGLALNDAGDAFVTGDTSSDNFPTVNALQPGNGGGIENRDDAFIVKIGEGGPAPTPTPTPIPTPTPVPTPTPIAITLTALTLNPANVEGGQNATGTVVLSGAAPSGGAFVTLASSDIAVVSVPASVTVAAGASTASFTISTASVTSAVAVPITAVYGKVSRTAILGVVGINPGELLTINQAEYTKNRKWLRVSASDSKPTAVLKVYVTASGAFMGTLSSAGDGSYSGVLSWSVNPKNITVRSSLGASATSAVTATGK